jgi:hypothetical protein
MYKDRIEETFDRFNVFPDLNVYASIVFKGIIEAIAEQFQSLAGRLYSRLMYATGTTDSHLYVEDGHSFPDKGLIMIDREFISYEREDSSLRVTQRGCLNTKPEPHEAGSIVIIWHPKEYTSQLVEVFKQTIVRFVEGKLLDLFVKDRGLNRYFMGSWPNDPTLRRVVPVLYANRGTLPVVIEALRRYARFDYPRMFVTTHPLTYAVLVFIYRDAIRELDRVEPWEDDPQPLGVGGFYLPNDTNDFTCGGYFGNEINDILPYEQSLYITSPAELQIQPTLHTGIDTSVDYYKDCEWFLPYGCGMQFVNITT